MPSILEIMSPGPIRSGSEQWPLQPDSSTLKCLELHNSDLEPDKLQSIIASAPHIESFLYDHWVTPTPFVQAFRPRHVARSLHLIARSLKSLVVSGKQVVYGETFGCLQASSRLVRLEISLKLLVGPLFTASIHLEDVLPRSLQNLAIAGRFRKRWY